MSKASVKAVIDAAIRQNGNQEITATVLNSVLNQMVDEVPDVVNDVTTGGTGKALSAEMGKDLGTEVSQLAQDVTEQGNSISLKLGETIDITNDIELQKGYIERNGVITYYATWYYCVVPLKKGYTIAVSNTGVGTYPSLGIADNGNVGIGDTVTVVTGKSYTATADTWVVVSAGTRLNSLRLSYTLSLREKLYGNESNEEIPIAVISGKYPNSSGGFTNSSSAITGVFALNGADVVAVYNNAQSIGNYGILFSTDPTFGTVTHGFALYNAPGTITNVVIPDGALYMAVDTKDTAGEVMLPPLKGVGENADSVGKIAGALPNSFEALAYSSTLAGYPSTATGKLYEGQSWVTRVYDVESLRFVLIKHNCNNSVYGIALSNALNLADSRYLQRMLTYNSTDGTEQQMFIDVRGVKYLSVFSGIDQGVFDAEAYAPVSGSDTERINEIDDRFVLIEDGIVDSTIPGCYPRLDTQSLYQSSAFNTVVYNVEGLAFVAVKYEGANTTYYGIAFSEQNTVFDNTSTWKAYPSTAGITFIEVPTGAKFMALDKGTTKMVYGYRYDPDVLVKMQYNSRLLDGMFLSGEYGKRCIYIGDSISTADAYHWKGFMLSKFNVNYVRDSGTYIHPADGGISVIPPVSEPSSQTQKSIWYRCAGNRLGNYNFDFISLFGGTNDMNVLADSDLPLGAVSDTPYVDTLTGFSGEKAATLTATRPATLTFASALMGCIEMLHRDFPDKPIYLVTVMPCKASGYGNTLDANGVRLSERMAILQMQIAAKYNGEISTYASLCSYGVTAVPFYWKVRTYEAASSNALSIDGVHPNVPCGRIMADYFAQILNLR